MGLFDKKYCDICGKKIGLLGNRKLADGNLCKDCAKKLSPWFSDRKQATVAEIKEQLEWREKNKDLVDGFRASQVIGKGPYVLIDESGGTFTVADSADLEGDNPDILDLESVTGVNTDVSESRHEVYRKDKDGKNVSYNPPRYDYSYNFYCTIYVNCPFYSEMKFRLNTLSVDIKNIQTAGRLLQQFHPEYDAKYQSYLILGDDIKKKLLEARDKVKQGTVQSPVAKEPETQVKESTDSVPQKMTSPVSGTWTCPACGASNEGGKFCQYCGTARPS